MVNNINTISLRREVRAHKISFNPPLFIEVHVSSQESERSCSCVLGVWIWSLPTIYSIGFRNYSDSGTGNLINSGAVKLVLLAQISPLSEKIWSCMYFLLMSINPNHHILPPRAHNLYKHDVWFVFTSSYLQKFSCFILLFVYSGVHHISCCGFIWFVFVLFTLCCQFLWIFYFWLPLRYSLTFIYTCI